MWWALIHKITLHAKGMAGEKEMACCVRGYHVYEDMWAAEIGEVLVRRWCVVGKILLLNCICVKYFRVFL